MPSITFALCACAP